MSNLLRKYREIIGNEDIDIINDLINTVDLERLKKISYYCGMYNGPKDIYDFSEYYSRFDHSLNTALMYNHFKDDQNGLVATLLHDLSTPVFSHVVDIMENDSIKQEYTEEFNKIFISSAKDILIILEKYGIDYIKTLDPKKYSISDNRPKLCINRLDAILVSSLIWNKSLTINEVQEIYNNLKVKKVKRKEELVFTDFEIAKKLFNVAMIDTYKTEDYADTFAMCYLADLTKVLLLENKDIKKEDLFVLNEVEITNLFNSASSTIKNRYNDFKNIKREDLETSNEEKLDYYCFPTETKQRFIIPFVEHNNKTEYLTTIDKKSEYELIEYLNYSSFLKDNYVYSKKLKK